MNSIFITLSPGPSATPVQSLHQCNYRPSATNMCGLQQFFTGIILQQFVPNAKVPMQEKYLLFMISGNHLLELIKGSKMV